MPFGTIKEALPCIGKRNTLSICMIVKNEEANIGRALESFQPFADEIIVNDTGSTDKTVEIVQSFPKTTLIQSEWIGDFAYSRNLSLDKATCSWILWMDADDYVPPDQVEAFKKLKLTALDRMISFTICNTENGKPTGMKFMQARMVPNHPKIRFEGRIHENLVNSANRLGLNIVNTNVVIWHMGYETLEIRLKKAKRNLDIQLADPEQEKRIEGLIELGDSYYILEDMEKSMEYYKRASEYKGVADTVLKINAANKFGRILTRLKRYDDAKAVFEKNMKQAPKDDEAYHGLAIVLVAQGQKKEGMALFRKVLTLKTDVSVGGTNYHSIRLDTLKNLSLWEFEQENFKLSRNYAEEMLKLDKDNAEGKWLFDRADEEFQKKKDKRPLLSLCMIAKNEENNIGQCLESAQGLADEIIVTDTGSTDKTIEIAKSYGAKIERFKWIKDFSAARNYSISKATSRWVIWLDADDRLPKKTVEELRKRLEQETLNKAFYFIICNSADEGKTGTRFAQIRVFPNDKKILFEGRIHEQPLSSIRKHKYIEENLPFEIFHTGYEDPALVKEKQLRNLEIFKEEYPNPEKMDPNVMYHYAVCYEIAEDYENTLIWLKKSLEKAKKEHYDEYKILIPQNIAKVLINLGKTDEAMDYLNESLKEDPYYEPSISLKAGLFAKLGKTDEAVKWFGYLASFVPKISILPSNAAVAHINSMQFLGNYWSKTEQPQIAIDILKTLKSMLLGTTLHNPFALSEIYVAHDRAAEALENLELLKSEQGNKPEFAFLYGQALALSGKVQEAIDIITKAKEKFPQNSDLAELAKAMGI